MNENVLVLVQNALVCDDVIETVMEVHPSPMFRIAADPQEAVALLEAADRWAFAIIDVEDGGVGMLPVLHDPLRDRDIFAVVIGSNPPVEAPQDWIFLEPPFKAESLRVALIQSLLEERRDARG